MSRSTLMTRICRQQHPPGTAAIGGVSCRHTVDGARRLKDAYPDGRGWRHHRQLMGISGPAAGRVTDAVASFLRPSGRGPHADPIGPNRTLASPSANGPRAKRGGRWSHTPMAALATLGRRSTYATHLPEGNQGGTGGQA